MGRARNESILVLIATCAELVDALLREAPALRISATSREALGFPRIAEVTGLGELGARGEEFAPRSAIETSMSTVR